MKAILISGANSGIGLNLTQELSKSYHIFAGYRSDKSVFYGITNVTPVKLDVRNLDEINSAKEIILNSEYELFALINNAGLGDIGFISSFSDEEIQNLFNVNVFGVYRLTNKFLPDIINNEGRIIIIGSQGGMISKKLYGPYTMTKHALEAYAIALQDEVSVFNTHVSIIQPGGIITNIGRNSFDTMMKRLQNTPFPFDNEAKIIAESIEKQTNTNNDEIESEDNRKPSHPIIVTESVQHALGDNPKNKYLVGTEWEGNRVLNALFYRILEENDNITGTHSLNRDQLIKLLDVNIKLYNMNNR